MQTRRPSAATWVLAVAAGAMVILQLARFVTPGSDRATSAAFWYAFLGAIVPCVVVFLIIRTVWAKRKKSTLAALRAQFPTALICDAFPSLSFVSNPEVETAQALPARSKTTQLALVADARGLRFVRGNSANPRILSWDDIGECVIGEVRAGIRLLPSLTIRSPQHSARDVATLVLRRPQGGGMLPASHDYVSAVAARIEGFRPSPTRSIPAAPPN